METRDSPSLNTSEDMIASSLAESLIDFKLEIQRMFGLLARTHSGSRAIKRYMIAAVYRFECQVEALRSGTLALYLRN